MPQPQPPMSRAARQREEARERARRHRAKEQAARDIDETILAAMLKLVRARVREDGKLVWSEKDVVVGDVVGVAAYRLGGGRDGYHEALERVLARLEGFVPPPA